MKRNNSALFSLQAKEVLGILEELQEACETNQHTTPNMFQCDRLTGYFCSGIVFNLSDRVLSKSEIRVSEKCLEFAPIQNKINEPESRKDFQEFCRHIRIKCNFGNEPSENFSEFPLFKVKSTWKPPMGHSDLEVSLSQIEEVFF